MEKQWYRVAPGVPWVNGARAPAGRRVLLTAAEAEFDLGLGRIALDARRPPRKREPSDE